MLQIDQTETDGQKQAAKCTVPSKDKELTCIVHEADVRRKATLATIHNDAPITVTQPPSIGGEKWEQ